MRSGVVSDESVNDRRTSYGVWLSGARRDKTVLDLQHRLHSWIGIPEEFGESLYMLRYEQVGVRMEGQRVWRCWEGLSMGRKGHAQVIKVESPVQPCD